MKSIMPLALAAGLLLAGPLSAAETVIYAQPEEGAWERMGFYPPARVHLAARKLCLSDRQDRPRSLATKVVDMSSGHETVYDCQALRRDQDYR